MKYFGRLRGEQGERAEAARYSAARTHTRARTWTYRSSTYSLYPNPTSRVIYNKEHSKTNSDLIFGAKIPR